MDGSVQDLIEEGWMSAKRGELVDGDITLSSLQRAAIIVGRRVSIELV
jgi:hypothetical protein